MFCDSKKVHVSYEEGQEFYECKECGEAFNQEDVQQVSGKKSKTKQKFTGRLRE